jgi:hypothetical protein
MVRINYFILIILLFVLAKPAQAYLDPGTGSYIIQIVIAFVLSSLFIFKSFFKNMFFKVKNIFSKSDNENSKSVKTEVDEQNTVTENSENNDTELPKKDNE